MLNLKKCIFYSFIIVLPLLVTNKIMASETKSKTSHSHKEAVSNRPYNRVGVVFPKGKQPCSVCDCKDFTIHTIESTKCIWCEHSCKDHGCKK